MILKTFSTVYLFLFSFFYYLWAVLFDNGVTATIKIPDNIKPGETVVAEVVINKGNVGGFAKLQIEVGQGLSISEDDSKGATFSFSGNTAKWIWTALPMESEFKVKFKVTANASASSNTSISGKFSYIVNNAKQVSEIPTKNITIGTSAEPVVQTNETNTLTPPAPKKDSTIATNVNVNADNVNVSVNTNTTTEITNTSQTPTTPATPPTTPTPETTSNVNISRNIQNIAPDKWLIKITINKGSIKGFARYTDVLPPSLTAKAEEKDGSSFFVDGNSIKFVWSMLPEKETLVISYLLTGTITSAITLNGDFSYTENNQVLSKTLPPETIQATSISATPSPAPQTPAPVTNVAETSTQAKQTSVFFSVQLGAFLKSGVTANYFIRKYNVKDVKLEAHESYKKFYSGNFEEYKNARDYREEIKTKGIQDAFVIAHKNNIRITVQEALMITNQKWYP